MPRLRADQFNCKGSVPVYLSDMKDGEIRVTDDGVYCKYGTHIYKVDWDDVQVSTTSSTTSSTSTSSTTTTTTPPCSVFLDEFTSINPADWNEGNPNNIASPGVNGYEHLVHVGPGLDVASISANGLWRLGGDFDTVVEVDITAFQGLSPIGFSGFYYSIQEGYKGGESLWFNVRNLNGVIEYHVAGGGNLGGGISVPTSTGKHYLRFARSGTTVTFWYWNDTLGQWEWNGNTAGWAHDGVWNVDPYARLRWSDTTSVDWVEGTVRSYCINAGVRV